MSRWPGPSCSIPAAAASNASQPGTTTLGWDAPFVGGHRIRKVRHDDGAPLTGLRGLYRTPPARWFPLTGDEAVEDAACSLIAVHAQGCAATLAVGVEGELVLAPPPGPCDHITVPGTASRSPAHAPSCIR